jgi:argininosuccinate synthase
MRNLDIADSRARLEKYAEIGLVGSGVAKLVGTIDGGMAKAIATGSKGAPEGVEAAQQRSGMESGTD